MKIRGSLLLRDNSPVQYTSNFFIWFAEDDVQVYDDETTRALIALGQPSSAYLYEVNERIEVYGKIVMGYSFKAVELFKYLVCYEENILSKGYCLSDEIRYCINLFKCAISYVKKGCFLPMISKDSEGTYSFMSQYYIFDDKVRLACNQLVKLMPPSLKGYFEMKTIIPEFRYVLNQNFFDYILNYFITQFIKHEGNFIEVIKNYTLNREEDAKALDFIIKLTNGISLPNNIKWRNDIIKRTLNWLWPLNRNLDKRFQTVFKLSEPTDGNWKINYLVECSQDNVLLEKDLIWRYQLNSSSQINHYPGDRLLSDLGKLSEFMPIRRSLSQAQPIHCDLDIEELKVFFAEVQIKCVHYNIKVILPESIREFQTIKLDLTSKSKNANTKLTLNSVLSFNWKVAIGDNILSGEIFNQIIQDKLPVLQINGEWVRISDEQMNALENLYHQKEKKIRIGDLIRYKLGDEMLMPGVYLGDVYNNAIIAQMMEGLTQPVEIEKYPISSAFTGKMRPYQIYGYSWMCKLINNGYGVCLADDMGLGKTIQLIAVLLYKKQHMSGTHLIICPTSVAGNWVKEIERFAKGLRVHLHQGSHRLQDESFKCILASKDVVITTYPLIIRDAILSEVAWSGVILDEAQNIKNAENKQTKIIKRLKSQYRVALTGTPIENRLTELWSIIDFLNTGYLGSKTSFQKRFAIPIEKENDTVTLVRLKKIIQPFILRRLKTDPKVIQDLPDKDEIKLYCSLTEEQAGIYEAILQSLAESIYGMEGMKRKGVVLAAISKLKQVCNHPTLYLKDKNCTDYLENKARSGKQERLFEMLKDILREKNKVLIFTQYAEMGHLLKRGILSRLGIQALYLHGGIKRVKREEMIEQFQQDDGPNVFILSLKAAGVGLNLTKANYVFHFDRWWNPAIENQATDRAYRIGQQRNVVVHKFITPGTLEEQIDQIIDSKIELADRIMNRTEQFLLEMDNETLLNFLKLNREFVVE